MVDFLRILWRKIANFSPDFLAGFSSGGFEADFLRSFGRFFLGSCLGLPAEGLLKTFPEHVKQRTWEIFPKSSQRNSRTDCSCLWAHCCSLGAQIWPGNRTPPPPPQTLQILGVAARHGAMPMLRGMLLGSSSFVYFPSMELLLRVAKQHWLAFGHCQHFRSLRKAEQKEKSQKSIKQQPEGPLTEDPSAQESHHNNGRVSPYCKKSHQDQAL